jgi:hypothetical protein
MLDGTSWQEFVVTQPCLRCGRDATGGRHAMVTVSEYPRWIWLLLPLLLLPAVVLYFVLRTTRQIAYSLCRRCRAVQVLKAVSAAIAWGAFVGALVGVFVADRWELWASAALWEFFVAVLATATSSRRLARRNRLSYPRPEGSGGLALVEDALPLGEGRVER